MPYHTFIDEIRHTINVAKLDSIVLSIGHVRLLAHENLEWYAPTASSGEKKGTCGTSIDDDTNIRFCCIHALISWSEIVTVWRRTDEPNRLHRYSIQMQLHQHGSNLLCSALAHLLPARGRWTKILRYLSGCDDGHVCSGRRCLEKMIHALLSIGDCI